MNREMEIGLLIGQATRALEDVLKVAFYVNTKKNRGPHIQRDYTSNYKR